MIPQQDTMEPRQAARVPMQATMYQRQATRVLRNALMICMIMQMG